MFFTRNGKKLEEVTNTLKTQNLFPTVGATGPCTVHVNFGQMGFVFIEANVKKWGLAPLTGSLAPPPPYGSEQGSILLEGGQHGVAEGQGWHPASSRTTRPSPHPKRPSRNPRSPGPQRSPTDISLATFVDDGEYDTRDDDNASDDAGEGASLAFSTSRHASLVADMAPPAAETHVIAEGLGIADAEAPPPEYESPSDEEARLSEADGASEHAYSRRSSLRGDDDDERGALLAARREGGHSPPIPSYDVAVGSVRE